jgi:hypothetical protein
MKEVARSEIEWEFYDIGRPELIKSFQGPSIVPDFSSSEYGGLKFVWSYPLEWGDTAKVSVRVTESAALLNLFNDREHPPWSMTMNWQYKYVYSGHQSNVQSILPVDVVCDTASLRLYKNSDYDIDGVIFLKSKNLLFYFLKEGYFEVYAKSEEFVAVAFFEPIAKVSDTTKNGTRVEVSSAKIYVNPNCEIMIVPVLFPAELYHGGYQLQ